MSPLPIFFPQLYVPSMMGYPCDQLGSTVQTLPLPAPRHAIGTRETSAQQLLCPEGCVDKVNWWQRQSTQEDPAVLRHSHRFPH